MFRRKTYLENSLVLADSGEKTFDITVRDPITTLWLLFEATNGASYNQANTLYQCIDTIEIIDGSEVLFSLDGVEALALAAYQLRRMPPQVISELPGNPHEASIPILFGRWLGDQALAFDPTKFANPQLRLKWNLANVNDVGDTGFSTGSGRFTLLADVMEGVPAPVGFLMSKEWYSWTTASGGVEYIDLPKDYSVRSMLLRAEKAASYVDQIVSKIKLSCDAGKLIPFDIDTLDLIFNLNLDGYRFDYRHVFHCGNGNTLYPLLKYEEDVQLISEDLDDVVYKYPNYGYGQGAVAVYKAGSAFGAHVNTGAHVHGMCPFRTLYIPMGEDDDAETWFDPRPFGSVRLEATGATASGSGYLVLTQARPY